MGHEIVIGNTVFKEVLRASTLLKKLSIDIQREAKKEHFKSAAKYWRIIEKYLVGGFWQKETLQTLIVQQKVKTQDLPNSAKKQELERLEKEIDQKMGFIQNRFFLAKV